MKRIISCFLITILLLNSFFVLCYADDDSFVTKALSSVREKTNIPDNYINFNSKLSVEANKQYAYFTWYGDEDEENEGGQLNVTVDDKLRIISFSQYFYGDFNGDYKLSDYTVIDAENEAISFISQICPEFYDDIRIMGQEYAVHRNFEPYEFKFIRYVNGLPCYDNYIDVTVDASNGKVSSLEVCWTDYDKIYPQTTMLNQKNAKTDMYEKIGFVSEYARNDDGAIYVRYADLSDGINYINAYTGNLINTNNVSRAGEYKNSLTSQKSFDFWYSDVSFDLDYVKSIIENNGYIPFDLSYTLSGIQFVQDDYSVYAYMEYSDAAGNIKQYIVDAVNGDVRYYNMSQQQVGSLNYNYSEEYCMNIADEFVNNYVKSFIDECGLLNYNKAKNYIGEDVYYFNYTRYINGISYDENGVVVGVSRSTGDVVSVISGWEQTDILEYSPNITAEDAFEKYIDVTGFELQYVSAISMTQQTELRLVYAPNPLYDYYVDATTGEVIDREGNVVNNEKIEYTDINGDISKDRIITLTACGIFDESDKFYPKENVLLCDYLLWMCRTIDCVEYKDISEVSDKLVESGIITYDDLLLNRPVNMETGIKYIVSYLGYDDVATLTDTYKTDFVDEGMISPGLIGYAAIAKGLKIFEGNAFLPKEYMKRNVAAQIFYNLITN